jgi:tetratricopeptide (TPR) repeat protein
MTLNTIFSTVNLLFRQAKYECVILEILHPEKNTLRHKFRPHAHFAWYYVADTLFTMGDFDKAIHAYRRALTVFPNDLDSLCGVAGCYSELNRPWMAEKYYRKAILSGARGVKKYEIKYNLANAIFDQCRYADSEILFKKLSLRKDEVGLLSRKNLLVARKILNELGGG